MELAESAEFPEENACFANRGVPFGGEGRPQAANRPPGQLRTPLWPEGWIGASDWRQASWSLKRWPSGHAGEGGGDGQHYETQVATRQQKDECPMNVPFSGSFSGYKKLKRRGPQV